MIEAADSDRSCRFEAAAAIVRRVSHLQSVF